MSTPAPAPGPPASNPPADPPKEAPALTLADAAQEAPVPPPAELPKDASAPPAEPAQEAPAPPLVELPKDTPEPPVAAPALPEPGQTPQPAPGPAPAPPAPLPLAPAQDPADKAPAPVPGPVEAPAEPPKPAPNPSPPLSPPKAPLQPPKIDAPKPATVSPPKPLSAKSEGGFNPGKVFAEAKGRAHNALDKVVDWASRNPWQAGAVGAGVALGTAIVGWIIFKALQGGKEKGKGGHREKRSVEDFHADIMEEFPSTKRERRAIIDEIDWNNEEFLEFLSLLPEFDDILQEFD